MFNDMLSYIHFWGWQLIIVFAALTFIFGITTGKEYAELEWPIDILVAIIWVIFGWNMFGTILKRRVRHIYVAIWFYIATFVTVAVLHIVNSIAIPVSLLKSYPVYAGVQDALVQWWYGHNAVAFFLTTPYLGLMYYFLPKAANRPIYSYRLSIIHFWALIFLYIWAGPHHLLYGAIPNWAQTLGMVFSIMLIAPSWGGMVNGLLTLRGAWDKVREDPVLKFFVVAVTAYGMSTLEGPMMSVKSYQCIHPFHRLDHSTCPRRRTRLERIPDLRDAVLDDPANVQYPAIFTPTGQISISGSGHSVLSFMPSRFTGALLCKPLCGKSLLI